jgi:ABC-2 type transport system ATP-binding protein
MALVEVRDLTKKYGNLTAVDSVSFDIREGEIWGLLGPNGAGKSTIISVLTCLLAPTSGTARIAGHDVTTNAKQVKNIIGIVPQDVALYPTLSARDNLRLFGEMFGLRGKVLRERVESALEVVVMTDRANDPIKTYSGGMKRRVNLAAGLINDPRVLFLDEPTVGVDPQSRNHIFESVIDLNREQGMTVLYTTHYMEEAERLCHRIAIIDRGEIIAEGTTEHLLSLLGGGIIQIGLEYKHADTARQVTELSQVEAAEVLAPADPDAPSPGKVVLKVQAIQADEALIQVIQFFKQQNIDILSIETLEPNLESVFLHLTGKSLRQ